MKFVEPVVNSKMLLNSIMEIARREKRAENLKVNERKIVDADLFFDTDCIEICINLEDGKYSELFRLQLRGGELTMEVNSKKETVLQLDVFNFVIKNASDYEYAFNSFVGAY